MAKNNKNTTGGGEKPSTLLGFLGSEVKDLKIRTEEIADKTNTLGGQMGLITKIVWLMFALVLTTAATGIIKHIIGGLTS